MQEFKNIVVDNKYGYCPLWAAKTGYSAATTGQPKNAAIMYSMLGCCKAHEVNFRDWMVFFLNNIHK